MGKGGATAWSDGGGAAGGPPPHLTGWDLDTVRAHALFDGQKVECWGQEGAILRNYNPFDRYEPCRDLS